MMKRVVSVSSIAIACAALSFAQNQNSNSGTTTRTRTVAPKTAASPKPGATDTSTRSTKPTTTAVAPSTGVLAAFDKIIDGIRKSNVDLYMSGYWNSSSLTLFNFNGTVTKGWDQLKQNRESSFPDSKDVKLDIRDRHVVMLGRDGAVVSCVWTESLVFKGKPETDTGRMTLVFKRFGNDWKAVHLHTSNDNPDPSRVPASEQTPPNQEWQFERTRVP